MQPQSGEGRRRSPHSANDKIGKDVLSQKANEADSRRESRAPRISLDVDAEPADDFVAEPIDEVLCPHHLVLIDSRVHHA